MDNTPGQLPLRGQNGVSRGTLLLLTLLLFSQCSSFFVWTPLPASLPTPPPSPAHLLSFRARRVDITTPSPPSLSPRPLPPFLPLLAFLFRPSVRCASFCLGGRFSALVDVFLPWWASVCLDGRLSVFMDVFLPWWTSFCLGGRLSALVDVFLPWWTSFCFGGRLFALVDVFLPWWTSFCLGGRLRRSRSKSVV